MAVAVAGGAPAPTVNVGPGGITNTTPGADYGSTYPLDQVGAAPYYAPTKPGLAPQLSSALPVGTPQGGAGGGTNAAQAQYLNELAAIEGPAQAPGVDMSQYIKSFNDSYSQQMANIKAGLTQSLGELQGRRDQAAAITAKFPQMVNSDYANVTAAGAPLDASGLSAEAQRVAAPMVAHDAGVGRANAAAAKGDTAYQQLGITANTQSGEAALNASANSAEAAAAAQRDQAAQALALQQAGFQDQWALARQQAGGQFTASQIAAGNAPSGIPGLTVSQYQAIQSDPAFGSKAQQLTTMSNSPQAFTYENYTQMLNNLTPQQRLVLQATNPSVFALKASQFGTQQSLYGSGVPNNDTWNADLQAGLRQMPGWFQGAYKVTGI